MPVLFGRRSAATLLALGAAATAGGARPALPADPLVGTWVLHRLTDTPDRGFLLDAFGAKPVGLSIFTPDGHFSFSTMRR